MKEPVQFPFQVEFLQKTRQFFSGRSLLVQYNTFYRCTIELNHPGLGYRTIDELRSM